MMGTSIISSCLLLYDRAVGTASFFALIINTASFVRNTNWRHSWDIIVPGKFGTSGYTGLLMYDRAAGT
jgi:hypothetical protein